MRHAASMDMTSLSRSRCSEGAPVWGIEPGSGVRASEDYACTVCAAIRNVGIDGLPPFSGRSALASVNSRPNVPARSTAAPRWYWHLVPSVEARERWRERGRMPNADSRVEGLADRVTSNGVEEAAFGAQTNGTGRRSKQARMTSVSSGVVHARSQRCWRERVTRDISQPATCAASEGRYSICIL